LKISHLFHVGLVLLFLDLYQDDSLIIRFSHNIQLTAQAILSLNVDAGTNVGQIKAVVIIFTCRQVIKKGIEIKTLASSEVFPFLRRPKSARDLESYLGMLAIHL